MRKSRKLIACENLLVYCTVPNIPTYHTNTVFCRIHPPAQTSKYPEGRVYSGLIISKSERCRADLGIAEPVVSFLMRANQAFMHASH